jgi:hypothetical protein
MVLKGLAAALLASMVLSCTPSGVTPVAATPNCDQDTTRSAVIRSAGERFFLLFNQRKLDDVMMLFRSDARTYYARRGEPVTGEFKETGTTQIRQMLSERMASGEMLQVGSIVTVSSGGSTTGTGTFPDGFSRKLDVKYGFDCRAPGFSQLLITPTG